MPTHRRVDLTNLLEALNDILVKYGVIEDDNSNVVVSVDGSRVLYDKENARTEVEITEV
jgi:Holliday junction resolvase RusA-like endonuclease